MEYSLQSSLIPVSFIPPEKVEFVSGDDFVHVLLLFPDLWVPPNGKKKHGENSSSGRRFGRIMKSLFFKQKSRQKSFVNSYMFSKTRLGKWEKAAPEQQPNGGELWLNISAKRLRVLIPIYDRISMRETPKVDLMSHFDRSSVISVKSPLCYYHWDSGRLKADLDITKCRMFISENCLNFHLYSGTSKLSEVSEIFLTDIMNPRKSRCGKECSKANNEYNLAGQVEQCDTMNDLDNCLLNEDLSASINRPLIGMSTNAAEKYPEKCLKELKIDSPTNPRNDGVKRNTITLSTPIIPNGQDMQTVLQKETDSNHEIIYSPPASGDVNIDCGADNNLIEDVETIMHNLDTIELNRLDQPEISKNRRVLPSLIPIRKRMTRRMEKIPAKVGGVINETVSKTSTYSQTGRSFLKKNIQNRSTFVYPEESSRLKRSAFDSGNPNNLEMNYVSTVLRNKHHNQIQSLGQISPDSSTEIYRICKSSPSGIELSQELTQMSSTYERANVGYVIQKPRCRPRSQRLTSILRTAENGNDSNQIAQNESSICVPSNYEIIRTRIENLTDNDWNRVLAVLNNADEKDRI